MCADGEWFTTEGEARGVYTMNDTLKAPKVPAFFIGGILFKLDLVWRFIPTKRLEHQAPSLGTSQQADTMNRSEGGRERETSPLGWKSLEAGPVQQLLQEKLLLECFALDSRSICSLRDSGESTAKSRNNKQLMLHLRSIYNWNSKP